MKTLILCSLAVWLGTQAGASGAEAKVVLVIHGGAASDKEKMKLTPESEKRYRAGLERAVRAGYAVFKKGGSSLDMVEASIKLMEDDPDFNAGRGAVFTSAGKNELDASIMEGRHLKAGAVASVTIVKNPISAARAVMEKSKHVLLVSEGANSFAKGVGLETVDPSYFHTEERWKEHEELLEEEKRQKPRADNGRGFSVPSRGEWSTVGAVALDATGTLAAGTSTGGMAEKRWGRVGDSPIIGAGTYADNEACGVSATGHGEYFIRYAAAHDIVALMKYKGLSVEAAADEVVNKKLKAASGSGGVIALDKNGRVTAAFNCEGLFRAHITETGNVTVKLFRE